MMNGLLELRLAFICWSVRWATAVTSKQNAHIKFKSLTANYKSFTSNTNRSHQIQIAHSKYISLTSSTNPSQQMQMPGRRLAVFSYL